MSSDSRELRTARVMAWERSKGELRSMLQTYWDDEAGYEQMSAKVDEFIEAVESEGLHE